MMHTALFCHCAGNLRLNTWRVHYVLRGSFRQLHHTSSCFFYLLIVDLTSFFLFRVGSINIYRFKKESLIVHQAGNEDEDNNFGRVGILCVQKVVLYACMCVCVYIHTHKGRAMAECNTGLWYIYMIKSAIHVCILRQTRTLLSSLVLIYYRRLFKNYLPSYNFNWTCVHILSFIPIPSYHGYLSF